MRRLIHAAGAVIAMACIATFWIATVVSELFLSAEAVAHVKHSVAWALLALVPALIATGASGHFLAAARPGKVSARKLARMRLIAGNGLFVLAPAAVFLAHKASSRQFDAVFVAVQVLELAAGAVNLWLMALNARDGLRLSGRFRRDAGEAAARTLPVRSP